jgi:hypothetical protein
MPGPQPEVFGSPNDIIANEFNVTDIDDTHVRLWALQILFVDGALVTGSVNVVAWVIRVSHSPAHSASLSVVGF